MLRAESATSLPLEIAKELRDALGRRQKELPPRWLAAHDAVAIRHSHQVPGHPFEQSERDIALTLLRNGLPDLRPRAIVCIQPSTSRATRALVDELRERGSVSTIAVTELDPLLAAGMLAELSCANAGHSSVTLACDCTVELPLPERFPRPRAYLCLGNAIGSTTTVGAVRMLRVVRTSMMPGDALVVGLEIRAGNPDPDDDTQDVARHMAAFKLLSSVTGAEVDLARFEYRRSLDSDNNRQETHLVARRAFQFEVPGVCDVRFKKGESIRTSVSCAFERNRVVAMMNGVGLTLRDWQTDPSARYAVALATPAV